MVTLRNTGGTVNSCPFPSWSWVGCTAEVYYDQLFGILDSEHAGLEIYALGSDGSPELIHQNSTYRREELPFSRAEREPPNNVWKEGFRTAITISYIFAAYFCGIWIQLF